MLKGVLKHLALFLFPSFIVLMVGIDQTAFNVYDEGIIAHGAQRVLNGEVPYRDFWDLYGPAQFWILAALYKFFGVSLLTERVWDTFIRAMIGLLSYLIARRLVSQPLAIVAWVLSLAWVWVVGFYGYPLLPALLFVLVSTYFFITFLSEPAKKHLLLFAGVAIGICACFRDDIGAYAVFAEGTLLLVLFFKSSNANSSGHRANASGFIKNLCSYCTGVALVGFPVISYLLWKVPVSDLWEQFLVYPVTISPSMSYRPYPSISEPLRSLLNGAPMQQFWVSFVYTVPFYFHFFILGAAALVSGRSWLMARKSGSNYWDGKRLTILFLAILTGLEFIKSLLRPSYVTLIHVIVLSLILSVVLLDGFMKTPGKVIRIFVSLSLVAMAAYPLWSIVIDVQRQFPPGGNGPERAWDYIIPPDQAAAIKFIQEIVPTDQAIFVGNGRHDKIFINDTMFYFLADRRCATKFDLMAPGQATTAEVQNQIIRELISNRVQYVVLVTKWDNKQEPNKSSESSKVKLLDDFLSGEYADVVKFGGYIIRKKVTRDIGPPTLE